MKTLKKSIRSKLKAEGVIFSDYENGIKVLEPCVGGIMLVKEYKSFFVQIYQHGEIQHIPKSLWSQIEGDYR